MARSRSLLLTLAYSREKKLRCGLRPHLVLPSRRWFSGGRGLRGELAIAVARFASPVHCVAVDLSLRRERKRPGLDHCLMADRHLRLMARRPISAPGGSDSVAGRSSMEPVCLVGGQG